MRQIKSRDTSPELALRKALFALGARGWRCNRADLPGKPDVVFSRSRVVVFVDGAFWHGHPKKFRLGQSGEYWDKKITSNMQRDQIANAALRTAGWKVIRLWDFDVLRDPQGAALKVFEEIHTSLARRKLGGAVPNNKS